MGRGSNGQRTLSNGPFSLEWPEKADIPKNLLSLNKIFLFAFEGKATEFRIVRSIFWKFILKNGYGQNIMVTHSALGDALIDFF